MGGENLTSFLAGFNRDDCLVATLSAALTSRASFDPASRAALIGALRVEPGHPERLRRTLATVAASLYAHPAVVEPTLVDRLAELAGMESLPDDIATVVRRLLQFLAASPAADRAWKKLAEMLRDEHLDASVRHRLLPLGGDFIRWREELVGLDGVLALAESFTSAEQRAFLLDHGVERFVFSAPGAFTTARLERIATLFAHAPRYRYVLRFLASRRELAADVRALLSDQLAGRFPLQDAAAAILVHRPVTLLVVTNIRLGQGDEIVRLAPLLQALLDANARLVITVIARRTYLYDNPRVTTVAVDDHAAVEAALAQPPDGIIELFQPDRAALAYRFELHAAVERVIAERRPAFVIRAELGRAHKGDLGIRSEFLYQGVSLGGRDIARDFGLDRAAGQNIYEPCMRLLAELGLPQRVAEEAPLTPALLTGTASVDAARVWADLVGCGAARSSRPVALVNPFGGAAAVKGFYHQDAMLAAEFAGLVDEGYLVVVLPNGTAWGGRATVLRALAHLDADTRAQVRVAPDPAETEGAEQLDLPERGGLAYADRIMRLFKYFASYADLVVTVEGWLAHLAYNLGRPFRLFPAAGSFGNEWLPYGRGARQRLVTSFSGRSRSRSIASAPCDGDRPPLAHGPRKALLRLALAELGGGADRAALPALHRALASADSDVRTWTVAALGRIAPAEARETLLAALRDPVPTVVREAAEALLRGDVDCRQQLGPRYRELLQAHADIVRQEWDAVARVGPAAFPALFRAGASASLVLATQARSLLRQMLRPYVRAIPAEIGGAAPVESAALRDALAGIAHAALVEPAALTSATLADLPGALRFEPGTPELCEAAVAALAALLYARPDLVGPALAERLADLVTTGGLPDRIGRAAAQVLEFMALSRDATRAWTQLSQLLTDERVEASRRELLIPIAAELLRWRSDVAGLDSVLALARSPLLAGHRAFLLDHGVERFVFCASETFTVERLEQIAALFADAPRYRYVLYSLAARRTLAPDVRAWLARALAGRFPLHDRAAAILAHRSVAILVALNVAVGQGDDVVRLVPLLQALLDANPALSITLLTWRTYLYDNPRVTTVAVGDDAGTHRALAGSFDGVIEFFQPEWPSFTLRPERHSAIERYLAEHRPALVVGGDLGLVCQGRVGDRFAFLYQTVQVDGHEIAESRGLDQAGARNVYDPTMRLLAELGLPQRGGEEPPLTPSVLTGAPSADAERIWAELAPESRAGKRPVVLLNPFGGGGSTKGFLHQDAMLAAEITGLVDEGYLVVVLPNGQSWGGRDIVLNVLSHLDAGVRAQVRVAPDPTETDEAARAKFRERSELAYADRVMRAFKYFAAYADLIVTVEGWLAHVAYNLGRPFRLFLAAGSFPATYHPRCRGAQQQLVASLSPRAPVRYAESALLRAGDPPPLPHRPRKSLLESALRGLGHCGADAAVAPLRRALTSPDGEVRTWAAAALRRFIANRSVTADLIAALKDRWPGVVREAADALLRHDVDCSRELGARYREVLQAYADIAQRNWDAVTRIGPAALPALFHAAESDVHDVKHGAKLLLRQQLSPFVRRLQVAEFSSPAAENLRDQRETKLRRSSWSRDS